MQKALKLNRYIAVKVTFAHNLAKQISTKFYYLSLLFQLSVAYSENFKEIKAWEVLKFFTDKIGILPIYLVLGHFLDWTLPRRTDPR